VDRCDVTVIIVNFNTRELLLGCLRSLFAQTRDIEFEVIVVDNSSSDQSVDAVSREFPRIQVIANTENRGFAAANNQGIRVAHGRYILLLNPDTIILDNAIAKTVRFADEHPHVGVVGCQVLENEAKVQRTCFTFPSPLNLFLASTGLCRMFPSSRFFGRHNMGWWNRDTEREVDVVSGMFFLVRREAIDQVGLLVEDYFVFAEETDWCYRFRHKGWKCGFSPVAQVIHLDGGGKSTSQAGVQMYVQLQKSLLIFHRKNLGWISFAAAKGIFIASMCARLPFWYLCKKLRIGKTPGGRLAQAMAALQYHLMGREPETWNKA